MFAVNGKDRLDALEFHQYLLGNNQVGRKRSREDAAVVSDRHEHLPAEGKPGLLKFVREALLVDGLEESRAELAVDPDRTTDQLPSLWSPDDRHAVAS